MMWGRGFDGGGMSGWGGERMKGGGEVKGVAYTS